MRVAYLAAASTIHTIKRVNALAKLGCTIDLITLQPPTGADAIDDRVTVHALPFRPPYGYVLNGWSVRRLLRRLRPHLLHAHYASGYGTLARLAGFHPTVLSVWGSDVFDFPYQAHWKKKLLCRNLAFADYIDASSWTMKRHTETLIKPRHQIAILPPGVDCEIFKPLARNQPKAELVVGTVRALEEKYGVEYLIRAFAMLPPMPERLTLLIVGDGPLRVPLERLAQDLGVGDVTEFVGSVPHHVVPEYMNRLAVFVAVSVHDSESFGVAVLEASACGVPVVVSDAGGLPEVVEDGTTGFVVPRRDVGATARAIGKLLMDPALRGRIGKAGRRLVLERYEWSENAARIRHLYDHIVEEWHGNVSR